jgi:hypothetical protein
MGWTWVNSESKNRTRRSFSFVQPDGRVAEAETGVPSAVFSPRAEAGDDARESTLPFLSEEAGSKSTRVLG